MGQGILNSEGVELTDDVLDDVLGGKLNPGAAWGL